MTSPSRPSGPPAPEDPERLLLQAQGPAAAAPRSPAGHGVRHTCPRPQARCGRGPRDTLRRGRGERGALQEVSYFHSSRPSRRPGLGWENPGLVYLVKFRFHSGAASPVTTPGGRACVPQTICPPLPAQSLPALLSCPGRPSYTRHASDPGLPSKRKGEADANAQQVQPLGGEGGGQVLIPWGARLALGVHETFEYLVWCHLSKDAQQLLPENLGGRRFLSYTLQHGGHMRRCSPKGKAGDSLSFFVCFFNIDFY